jgi:crotonobetaine/carnitine-CoA ligase
MVFDPRMPAPERCVLAYQLEHWARERPGQTAVIFHDGESWSWQQTLDMTRRAANGLLRLGVSHGDHVLSWQPNSRQALLTWFGLNYLGAVYVPLNVAYKGLLLEHVVQLSDARLMVCHADLAPRLQDIQLGQLTDIVITGGECEVAGARCHSESDFIVDAPLDGMPAPVAPWDTQYIIFTSGTTGPSKAVLSSYLQGYAMGPEAHPYVNDSDRSLVQMPLFHAGGTIYVIMTLAHGGSCFIDTHFKTTEFWDTIREHEITSICLVAAMIPFLLKLPPSDEDRNHSLKKGLCVPWNEDGRAVGERYGIEMRTCFNMTEVSGPLVSEPFPAKSGTCGQVRSGVEVRVVDENDCEVGPGVTGELILRTDRPWSLNHGYYKNPEATAAAWRNGWFHTGDGFQYDEDGYFYFVDRIKDSIRRRGENISSFEVENEVTAYAAVREAAAVAVPSEFGEDEVLIVVSAVAGEAVEPLDLFRFLEPRMAHFMLPRYIRVIDELPKTPTQKVMKHKLKELGITADTWDCEQAGIKIKREKIGA